jgi:hypothetical protein
MSAVFNAVIGSDAAASVDIGDNIANSLMLDSVSSQYLSRTFVAPTTQGKWTFSCWVKQGKLTEKQELFTPSTTDSGFGITTANKIYFYNNGTIVAVSTASYREPTAYNHLMIAVDTAAAGTAKVIIYVNGTALSSFTTDARSGFTTSSTNASAVAHYIGKYSSAATYGDEYIAQAIFVDGQQLTPSAFGRTSADTGQWVNKTYAGTYGNNGFKLDFANSADLGNDTSGNNNDWTLNSITSANQYSDTPTNSYCVLNPLAQNSTTTSSKGNLTFTKALSQQYSPAMSLPIPVTGVWYFEYFPQNANEVYGICPASANLATLADPLSSLTPSYGYYGLSGNKYVNNVSTAYGAAYGATDCIGVLVNMDALTITFYKQTAGIGAFASQGAISIASGTAYQIGMLYQASAARTFAFGFGARPFNYVTQHGSLPSSAKSLCTANLPTPAIIKPSLHFDVNTRVGTAATYSVTGKSFAPGLVWVKSRGRVLDHALYDTVRGVQKQLESNTTTAESTEATGITAFNSDGYTGGALDQINGTTATNSFVDWLWALGGAPTTDNVAGVGAVPTAGSVKIDGANKSTALAGSIAATRLSANTVAGQSVVTYTGTAVAATVGHGLLSAPELVIVRRRDVGNDWFCYHKTTGNTQYLILDSTAAAASAVNLWQNTTPTSTVFSINTNVGVNGSAATYLALCFHSVEGYSKVGSFVCGGNDFINLGFKPAYLKIKRTDSTSDWFDFDNKRPAYNPIGGELYSNLASAEATTVRVDFTATGFKVRATAATNPNVTGATYVFIAFAEAPTKYSTGR